MFLNGDVLLSGSPADLDGTLKWSRGRIAVLQGGRHQRSFVIRTEKGYEGRRHVSKLLRHCLPVKTFVPNFVAFFVLLAIDCLAFGDFLLCHYRRTGVYADHCFIINLPGGGHCPLARESEPIGLLEVSCHRVCTYDMLMLVTSST